MKRSSFKLKITFWITVLITLVCTLALAGIMIMGSKTADSELKQDLIGIVERNVDKIEYKNGILEIEKDFAFYYDEVYCNVFDEKGQYISGESPAALINSDNLKNGEVGTFEADGGKYYYYDTRLDFQKYEYEIDVISGQILKYEADTVMSEQLSGTEYKETNYSGGISTSKAVDIALTHAGTQRNSLSSLNVELTSDSGKSAFKVEFICKDSTYPPVWVRGVINADSAKSAFDAINKALIYILPLFIVIAAAGAYIISRRAMAPIENITRSAKEISIGGDLSKRIEIGKSSDELYSLAQTFNEMLASLQTSFETEKQFTSDASHELRTPLAVIKAECEFALSDIAESDDKEEALSEISEQADKMTKLVSALLTLSRTENGDKRYKLESTDISSLIKSAAQKLTLQKGITLESDIDKNIFMPAQPELFLLMAENLLSNAVKYGKENGEIRLSLKKSGNDVILTVKDNGIGIKEENLEKIFGRFFRADESRSKTEGFGLGLSLVKQIAELHSGEITVFSVYGEGSEFKIIFRQ